MTRFEVRMLGVGGQGVGVAGAILGRAATLDGKFATHWQSYGVESRGGPSLSEIVISEKRIDYPRVIFADVLTATEPSMLNMYIEDLKSGGLLILDSDLASYDSTRRDILVNRVPTLKTAESLGERLATGVIMVGTISAMTRIVTQKALLEAVKISLPSSAQDVNFEAVRLGMKLGETEQARPI